MNFCILDAFLFCWDRLEANENHIDYLILAVVLLNSFSSNLVKLILAILVSSHL
jgi:hypothetical protein